MGADLYTIKTDTVLNEDTLKEAYEALDMGGRLEVARKGKKIDFQKEGIELIKAGFIDIAQVAGTGKNGEYLISCKKGEKRDKLLSVIVPLYNEEATAGELLDKLLNRKWNMPVEFVIVESNSKDKTILINGSNGCIGK